LDGKWRSTDYDFSTPIPIIGGPKKLIPIIGGPKKLIPIIVGPKKFDTD
jgi:hypothetical protein